MQKWQLRPSQIGPLRRAACCVHHRQFNSNTHQLRSDEASPKPRHLNNRKVSAKASKDIQDLRHLAPGGSAPSPSKPNGQGQFVVRRVAYGQDNAVRTQNSDNVTSIVRRRTPSLVPEEKAHDTKQGRRPKRKAQRHQNTNEQEQSEEEGEDGAEALLRQEMEFFESLEEHIRGPNVHFTPEAFTPEDLITSRVATAVGPLGAFSEVDEATGRLAKRDDTRWGHDAALARKLMAGRLVKFKDDAEKIRVTTLAEGMAADTANKIQGTLEEPVETLEVGFVPVGADVRQSLADKVVRGHYNKIKPTEGDSFKDKSMDHLERSVLMNGSYTPTSGKSMLDYIEKMWPPQSTGPAPKQ
jgi:hypothetical protein